MAEREAAEQEAAAPNDANAEQKKGVVKRRRGDKIKHSKESDTYVKRNEAIDEIKQAVKRGVADNFDINNLVAAEREAAKYEAELVKNKKGASQSLNMQSP